MRRLAVVLIAAFLAAIAVSSVESQPRAYVRSIQSSAAACPGVTQSVRQFRATTWARFSADVRFARRYVVNPKPTRAERLKLRSLLRPYARHFELVRLGMTRPAKVVVASKARKPSALISIVPRFDVMTPCITKGRVSFAITLAEQYRSSNGYARKWGSSYKKIVMKNSAVLQIMTLRVSKTKPVIPTIPPRTVSPDADNPAYTGNPQDSCDPMKDPRCMWDGYACGNADFKRGDYPSPPDSSWEDDFQRDLALGRQLAKLALMTENPDPEKLRSLWEQASRVLPITILGPIVYASNLERRSSVEVTAVELSGTPWQSLAGDPLAPGRTCYDPVSGRIRFIAGIRYVISTSDGHKGSLRGDFAVIMWRGAIERFF